ncbi:hypothetical protein D3C76_871120 [compost metagenome]
MDHKGSMYAYRTHLAGEQVLLSFTLAYTTTYRRFPVSRYGGRPISHAHAARRGTRLAYGRAFRMPAKGISSNDTDAAITPASNVLRMDMPFHRAAG